MRGGEHAERASIRGVKWRKTGSMSPQVHADLGDAFTVDAFTEVLSVVSKVVVKLDVDGWISMAMRIVGDGFASANAVGASAARASRS